MNSIDNFATIAFGIDGTLDKYARIIDVNNTSITLYKNWVEIDNTLMRGVYRGILKPLVKLWNGQITVNDFRIIAHQYDENGQAAVFCLAEYHAPNQPTRYFGGLVAFAFDSTYWIGVKLLTWEAFQHWLKEQRKTIHLPNEAYETWLDKVIKTNPFDIKYVNNINANKFDTGIGLKDVKDVMVIDVADSADIIDGIERVDAYVLHPVETPINTPSSLLEKCRALTKVLDEHKDNNNSKPEPMEAEIVTRH